MSLFDLVERLRIRRKFEISMPNVEEFDKEAGSAFEKMSGIYLSGTSAGELPEELWRKRSQREPWIFSFG